jgi:hypothetical protein
MMSIYVDLDTSVFNCRVAVFNDGVERTHVAYEVWDNGLRNLTTDANQNCCPLVVASNELKPIVIVYKRGFYTISRDTPAA